MDDARALEAYAIGYLAAAGIALGGAISTLPAAIYLTLPFVAFATGLVAVEVLVPRLVRADSRALRDLGDFLPGVAIAFAVSESVRLLARAAFPPPGSAPPSVTLVAMQAILLAGALVVGVRAWRRASARARVVGGSTAVAGALLALVPSGLALLAAAAVVSGLVAFLGLAGVRVRASAARRGALAAAGVVAVALGTALAAAGRPGIAFDAAAGAAFFGTLGAIAVAAFVAVVALDRPPAPA